MPFDYTPLRTLASDLLTEFGQPSITLEQTTKGVGPSFEPGAGVTTYTALNAVGKGVAEYFKRLGLADASEMKFTSAVVTGIEPKIATDWIILDGTPVTVNSVITSITGGIRYKVIEWNPVPNRNVPIVWKFTARKG